MGAKPQPVRDRLIEAQAQRVELLNRKTSAELILTELVSAEWADIVARIKTRLLAIPARVAAAHPGQPADNRNLGARIDGGARRNRGWQGADRVGSETMLKWARAHELRNPNVVGLTKSRPGRGRNSRMPRSAPSRLRLQ